MISLSVKKLFYIASLFSISLFVFQCEKEPFVKSPLPGDDTLNTKIDTVNTPVIDSIILTHQDSIVVAKLPAYYRFLDHFRKEGYTFCDFRTYLSMDSLKLPEKLIVIRHDVHYRDLECAYTAFQIETILIGPKHSTFYVMLNDPLELANVNFHGEKDYLRFIQYLDSSRVDIQPHISPIDMYIAEKHPAWESLSVDSLRKLFEANYEWTYTRGGTKLVVTGEDIFDVPDINRTIMELLPAYNREWKNETKLSVQGYASHGSGTRMNYILNNAYLLDQLELLDSGIFQYDTYNTKIFSVLSYLSDNTLPPWMKLPETVQPGRYQFLMHPYQWKYIK